MLRRLIPLLCVAAPILVLAVCSPAVASAEQPSPADAAYHVSALIYAAR